MNPSTNMMIEINLTDIDVSSKNRLGLPLDKVNNLIISTGVPIPRQGIQVEIVDNSNSYWVNLRQDSNGYFIGSGWSSFKDARQLKAGDVIRLDWQPQDYKFIFSM
ncbi:PREDICTED: B3 domain-containing protein At1g08985-like [Camelina sativa]|uniref:B3 domain-containing protein At1g08985-like n=1 Tax=Camelina sativa TaxID=90675 RepID=A0ABM0WSZ4_CAMSA|nr:PREDICTED: B3 domain-containing protein At1g08985-like [Camelina sativa]